MTNMTWCPYATCNSVSEGPAVNPQPVQKTVPSQYLLSINLPVESINSSFKSIAFFSPEIHHSNFNISNRELKEN